jgi:hypothetical protein
MCETSLGRCTVRRSVGLVDGSGTEMTGLLLPLNSEPVEILRDLSVQFLICQIAHGPDLGIDGLNRLAIQSIADLFKSRHVASHPQFDQPLGDDIECSPAVI